MLTDLLPDSTIVPIARAICTLEIDGHERRLAEWGIQINILRPVALKSRAVRTATLRDQAEIRQLQDLVHLTNIGPTLLVVLHNSDIVARDLGSEDIVVHSSLLRQV